ncbi:MAG: hypothetical protein GY810_01600 [Aureispira sp.]|nr:hypothetical protein [Aureispira sp.]
MSITLIQRENYLKDLQKLEAENISIEVEINRLSELIPLYNEDIEKGTSSISTAAELLNRLNVLSTQCSYFSNAHQLKDIKVNNETLGEQAASELSGMFNTLQNNAKEGELSTKINAWHLKETERLTDLSRIVTETQEHIAMLQQHMQTSRQELQEEINSEDPTFADVLERNPNILKTSEKYKSSR